MLCCPISSLFSLVGFGLSYSRQSVNSGWGDAARLDVEMSAMVKVFTLKVYFSSHSFFF